jgi:hypothetical protein
MSGKKEGDSTPTQEELQAQLTAALSEIESLKEKLASAPTSDVVTEMYAKERQLLELQKGIKKQQAEIDQWKTDMERFNSDPVSWLEEKKPDVYTEWTDRVVTGKNDPMQKVMRVLETQGEAIKKLTETVEGTQVKFTEHTTKTRQQAAVQKQLAQFDQILAKPEYRPIFDFMKISKGMYGSEFDLHQAALQTAHAEMKASNGRVNLTVQEIADRFLAQAQEKLEDWPEAVKEHYLKDEESQTSEEETDEEKSTSAEETSEEEQEKAGTLTQSDETESLPADLENIPDWKERVRLVTEKASQ